MADPTQEMIASLTNEVMAKIRIRFGVIPQMTPVRVLELSDIVGQTILDYLKKYHNLDAIRDASGYLVIPPPKEGP